MKNDWCKWRLGCVMLGWKPGILVVCVLFWREVVVVPFMWHDFWDQINYLNDDVIVSDQEDDPAEEEEEAAEEEEEEEEDEEMVVSLFFWKLTDISMDIKVFLKGFSDKRYKNFIVRAKVTLNDSTHKVTDLSGAQMDD